MLKVAIAILCVRTHKLNNHMMCNAWNHQIITSSSRSSSCRRQRSLFSKAVVLHQSTPTKYTNENVVTTSSTATTTNNNEDNVRLSRPERKALERKRKEEELKRKNTKRLNSNGPRVDTVITSSLLSGSSSDDLMQVIKKAQHHENINAIYNISSFLLDHPTTNDTSGITNMECLLSRLTVAALNFPLHDVANKAMLRRKELLNDSLNKEREDVYNRPKESAAIIRALLRNDNVSAAIHVLDEELPSIIPSTHDNTNHTAELMLHRALALSSILTRHFFNDDPITAASTCKSLAQLGPLLHDALIVNDSDRNKRKWKAFNDQMPYIRMIQAASHYETKRRGGTTKTSSHQQQQLPCNVLYSILNIIIAFIPTSFDSKMLPTNSKVIYEMLSNAFIRRTVFVIGAVAIDQLPIPDRGEVVFIGRSNVGKSSLVNMITNRKSLAYTSKQPGKTQQFNYFAINDIPDLNRQIRFGDTFPQQSKDNDSFYLVDIPGYGYAHAISKQQKEEWGQLFTRYMIQRKTLKVMFHLIDSRHGILEDDVKIMKLIRDTTKENNDILYVMVLTKVDKNKKKMGGFMSEDVMNSVQLTTRHVWGHNKADEIPMILSSAESKLGRDEIWKYIRVAAEL